MEYDLTVAASLNGLDVTKTKAIHVNPLPPDFRKAIEQSGHYVANRCFDNSWLIVIENVLPDAEYVLALGVTILPVEHALICVEGKYYDPTWEMNLGKVGSEYLAIEQWGREALLEAAKNSPGQDGAIYPPMLRNLERSPHFSHLFK